MSAPKRPKIQTGRRASGEVYYYLRGLSTNAAKKPGVNAGPKDTSASTPKARKGRQVRVPKQKSK